MQNTPSLRMDCSARNSFQDLLSSMVENIFKIEIRARPVSERIAKFLCLPRFKILCNMKKTSSHDFHRRKNIFAAGPPR